MKVRSSVKPICKMQDHQKKGSIQSNLRESKTQTETGLIRQLDLTVWKRNFKIKCGCSRTHLDVLYCLRYYNESAPLLVYPEASGG